MRWTFMMASIWSSCLALASRVAGLAAFFSRKNVAVAAVPKSNSPRSPRQTAVIKPRPLSLEERYRPLDNPGELDQMFLRMRDRLYDTADAIAVGSRLRPRVILREAGRIGPKRPYFFLKPMSETGWLFERSGSGWVVSRAEKIVGQDTFLRRGEPWDIVTLHESASGSNTIRVTSQRIGGDLIPFSVYESKLDVEMYEQMSPELPSSASTGDRRGGARSDNLNDYLTGD